MISSGDRALRNCGQDSWPKRPPRPNPSSRPDQTRKGLVIHTPWMSQLIRMVPVQSRMSCRVSRTTRFRVFELVRRANLLHGLGELTRLTRPLAQSPFGLGIGRSIGKSLILTRSRLQRLAVAGRGRKRANSICRHISQPCSIKHRAAPRARLLATIAGPSLPGSAASLDLQRSAQPTRSRPLWQGIPQRT